MIVCNLQGLPANAIYGFSLPFLYLIAALGFFIPCVLVVAELSTTHPQTGGAYIWCEQAFGKKMGFVTVAVLWLGNLLWYPSFFTLIASNLAYLIDPALAHNKTFIISVAISMFWILTGLNCLGIKPSIRFSIVCSVIGIIMPMLLISVSGAYWWLSGQTLATTVQATPFFPNFMQFDHLGFLIAVILSLFGIDLAAVHAGDVINPKRDFPRSLLISGTLILTLLIFSELAIAVIVPVNQLNVVTGLLDAIRYVLDQAHLQKILPVVLVLIFIGNLGSVVAWMLALTRAMFIACQHNHVSKFLQITNANQAPMGVLLFEAVMFTVVMLVVYLLLPHISDSSWLLLALASQITLIYYVILFLSALRLRYLPREADGFLIPGGNSVMWLITCGAIAISVTALLLGFIAPPDLSSNERFLFHLLMSLGLLVALLLPLVFLIFKEKPAN